MTIDATEHRYVNKTESAFSYTLSYKQYFMKILRARLH